MEKILVSACLLGAKVRYHGGDAASDHPVLARWAREGRLVPICPEQEGGLPTPRPPAEIVGPDSGRGVIARLGVVRTAGGADITGAYLKGAQAAAALAAQHHVRLAVLKDASPSCGSAVVHDGTFTGRRVPGTGVTAALLESHGVRVFDERSIDAAAAFLDQLEGT